ncbi:MAG: putative toxin-antitoxin system toxin component, PIN family [Isosphaeraceae bacterium]|nr:putative toxin-antitoxin system toxin component, PIN family [Isosphaeraceae bacterium]
MSLEVRTVFDTNVVVSALLLEQSAPAKAFMTVLERGVILLSEVTFAELSEVLSRKKFDRYVTQQERQEFLAMLLREATVVEIDEEVRACRDPKDDKFLELAVSGSASCLVTGDEDLLVLHPFRDIPIMTPSQFLESL